VSFKSKPKNSLHRPEREQTPYKRIKRKVFTRNKSKLVFVDDDWVPLSEILKEG